MSREEDRSTRYQEGSLTLSGTVMLGTGVMIGAGIFALTGQMAQMTGVLFPLAFLAAALIVGFSAYSYIKISNAYPSAGGIGMYLHKAYGNRLPTAFNALTSEIKPASIEPTQTKERDCWNDNPLH